jgi:N-acetylglutamate synthase-like GNAT family acetyltransferase
MVTTQRKTFVCVDREIALLDTTADPCLDRRTTMILPEAQKHGLGSLLTRRCNQVADEAGRRTWAGVRPSSIEMFRSLGFEDVKMVRTPVERWGGSEELGKSWLLCREPQSQGAIPIVRRGAPCRARL